MAGRDKREGRRMDAIDRQSQVGLSRALRARDVSRPDPIAVAAALQKLDPTIDQEVSQSQQAGAARRSPRSG
jgi:hypothetical protein